MNIGGGIIIGGGIKLEIPPTPVITIGTQPSDASVTDIQTATFSVSATASYSGVLSYQWQKQESGTGSWTNISGATSSSYTTGSLTVADDNTDKYRVVVSATGGATSVTSNSATLTVTASSVPNSISVVSYDDTSNSGNIFYGASSTTSSAATAYLSFGTVTSDYVDALVQVAYYTNPNYVLLVMKPGSFTSNGSFDVSFYSSIDSDIGSYYRTFTINGSDYVFHYNGSSAYQSDGDLSGLLYNNIGSTVTVEYDAGKQPTYASNTMWIAYYSDGSNTFWGASSDVYGGPVFGQMRSSVFKTIWYATSNYTIVSLKPGSYGSFTVSNGGAIGSDTTGSIRHFTINGNVYRMMKASGSYYYAIGDMLNLINNVGQSWLVSYDPSVEASHTAEVEGTLLVANSSFEYGGKADYSVGGVSTVPDVVNNIIYNSMYGNTVITLNPGTYGNLTVTNTQFGGQSSLVANVGGTQVTSTSISGGVANMGNSDVFSLASNTGQLFTVKLTVPAAGGGGGGGGGTYTSGIDYGNGAGAPPGMYIVSMGGGSYSLMLEESAWTNTAGVTALLQLTSGDTFDVTMPATSTTSFTLTLTSSWSSPYQPGSWDGTATASAPLTLPGASQNVPSTISLGGGGNTVTLVSGAWFDDGSIFFGLASTDTAGVAIMDAIGSGATITIADSTGSTTVTLVGTLSKIGPVGPAGNQRYFYDGFVTLANSQFPTRYGALVSLTA